MRNFIRWATASGPGMNILMIAVLLGGAWAMSSLRRETFPEFDVDKIMISMPFPGATPEEVEEGICQKVEEAVRGIEGIKRINSTAAEGVGTISLELEAYVDNPDRVADEVRSAVDRIPSFPELAEDYDIKRLKMQDTVISINVLGPETLTTVEDEIRLREVAENVRNDLLLLDEVSLVNLVGSKSYQVDIEIPEDTLRSYGLSLTDVANIIRRENVQMPGGTIRTKSREIMIRSDNRRVRGEEIAKLPVIAQSDGAVLTVGDLGTVRDQFVDVASKNLVDRRPAITLNVLRNETDDMIDIVDAVKTYVAEKEMPPGFSLGTWGDRSVEVRSRLNLLQENGAQGLLIVFLLLAMFLDLKLAFWVALGIPFSLLATGGYLFFADQTLNMISMFAFIMALGIVVDDAIVVGENVFAHRNMGKPPRQAAIDGTVEVIPSVLAAVSTTVIAFSPLLFVSGIMGKFMAVMPVTLIAMLVASLFECMTILPCHLAHRDSLLFHFIDLVFYAVKWVLYPIKLLGRGANHVLGLVVRNLYAPSLEVVLKWRSVFLAGCVAAMILAVGFVAAGITPFLFFPNLDSYYLASQLSFPNGTPVSVTEKWTREIEDGFWRVADRIQAETGEQIGMHTFRTVGSQVQSRGHGISDGGGGGASHQGTVQIQLVDSESRSVHSDEVVRRWREEVGEVPGAEQLTFGSIMRGPGGLPIEVVLMAKAADADQLHEAVELVKERLKDPTYCEGIIDVADDDLPGKWEFRVRVRPRAYALGVRSADLADTIRASFYGAQVQRVQRGRHEVKIMVAYPRDQRHSLAALDELRVRTADGAMRPFGELAEVEVVRGYSSIHRVDQLRSIKVSADADTSKDKAVASKVIAHLKDEFLPEVLKKYPGVRVSWEGSEEERQESMNSLKVGFIVAVLVMFVLLAFQFRSYLQPMLILAIIPFGMIGAIAGHTFLGLPITMFSMFGLVALSGIVINDSIVLVDFINARMREGLPLHDAIVSAGARRFRPVMLTTTTTIGGLTPIMFETSFQAQILIPMAASIAFGEMFATILVLYLVPVLYSVYHDVTQFSRWFFRKFFDVEIDDPFAPVPTNGNSPELPSEVADATSL